MPNSHWTSPAPQADSEGDCRSQVDSLPAGYVYLYAAHPNTEFFNLHAYAMDSKHNEGYNPDLLTDEGISTG